MEYGAVMAGVEDLERLQRSIDRVSTVQSGALAREDAMDVLRDLRRLQWEVEHLMRAVRRQLGDCVD